MSFDTDYMRERGQMDAVKTGVGTNISHGFISFGKGIFEAVTGLFTQPIKGAMQEGALGFVKGLGKGLLGLVVKPVAGTLDLAAGVMRETGEIAALAIRKDNGPKELVWPQRTLASGLVT